MMPAIGKRLRFVANALRERRLALGMTATQEAIARQAGISLRHIQKLERGDSVPRLDTLMALARALATDVQSILDRAETLEHRKR